MPSLQQLNALLAKEPQDVFLNFARAMELAKLGRVEESLAQFDRVVILNADYSAAHFHKGRTLLAAGRLADAKAALAAGIATAQRVGDLHARDEMNDLLASI